MLFVYVLLGFSLNVPPPGGLHAQGGSLDNALVCDREKGWLNPPTRFDNEPARHKLLDLIGDMALLPALPAAHIVGYRSGHALHVELARKILSHWKKRGTYAP